MISFASIAQKVRAHERLSTDEGSYLAEYPDLAALGALANEVRERLHGNTTFYNWNLHLNATNVCEANCIFCSFARLREGMPEAYTMTIEEALRWIGDRYHPRMTEVHIVNGLNPDLPFAYYLDLLRAIRRRFAELHIKAFTAVEIHYFHERFGLPYAEIVGQLREAGLGSLPGGGAEIFAPRARRKLCHDKVDAAGWLDVHRTAHRLGLRSNCTMLFGTIETPEERVDHLCRLRSLQDETGGFRAFIPLAFHPDGNRLRRLLPPSEEDRLRVIALSRLMLDNIPHIKAYWVMLGLAVAQRAQHFGANDLDGTVTEEKIYRMAGATTPGQLSIAELQALIRATGREPVERNTTYDHFWIGGLTDDPQKEPRSPVADTTLQQRIGITPQAGPRADGPASTNLSR